MRKYKNTIMAVGFVIALLAVSLIWGGFEKDPGDGDAARGPGAVTTAEVSGAPVTNTAGLETAVTAPIMDGSPLPSPTEASQGGDRQPVNGGQPQVSSTAQGTGETPLSTGQQGGGQSPDNGGQKQGSSTAQGAQETPVSGGQQGGGQPQVSTPQTTDDPNKELTVTLTIDCSTLLNNMDRLAAEKAELVPQDGVIFSGTVVFYEGESVFNVLQRATRANRIHFESVNVPIYNSAYIEGINNLYEFDAGAASGWMYSVNGVFPNYGSSRYTLQDGDAVRWRFTCDRGDDIGGRDASGAYNFGN